MSEVEFWEFVSNELKQAHPKAAYEEGRLEVINAVLQKLRRVGA